jgi:CheY-like chemotaxis protein
MSADQHALRVVVIDDNQDAADSLARILKLWGHEAWAAYDGPTGLATALVCRPDVILLDVSLPRLDGFALIAALRQQPACREVLIVSVSAHNDFELVTRLFERGVSEHFPKPVNLIALKALLDKRRNLARGIIDVDLSGELPEPPEPPAPPLSNPQARLQYIREIPRRTAHDHLFLPRVPGDLPPARRHGGKGRALQQVQSQVQRPGRGVNQRRSGAGGSAPRAADDGPLPGDEPGGH